MLMNANRNAYTRLSHVILICYGEEPPWNTSNYGLDGVLLHRSRGIRKQHRAYNPPSGFQELYRARYKPPRVGLEIIHGYRYDILPLNDFFAGT